MDQNQPADTPAQPEAVAQPQPEPAQEQPAQAQPEPEQTPEQKFLAGFEKLRDETGLTFSVEPKFKHNPDGSYDTSALVIQTTVVKK